MPNSVQIYNKPNVTESYVSLPEGAMPPNKSSLSEEIPDNPMGNKSVIDIPTPQVSIASILNPASYPPVIDNPYPSPQVASIQTQRPPPTPAQPPPPLPEQQFNWSNLPEPNDTNIVDYVAISYKIANILRNSDQVAYKQCSNFYKNNNTIYIIIIIFLLICCIYFFKTSQDNTI